MKQISAYIFGLRMFLMSQIWKKDKSKLIESKYQVFHAN